MGPVHAIWEIDSIFDIEYEDGRLEKMLIKGRDTDEYDEKLMQIIEDAKTEFDYFKNGKSRHHFFCGKPEETKYVKKNAPWNAGKEVCGLTRTY